jgi:hypothetical protein
MTAYIQTKHARPDGSYDSFLTVSVDYKEAPMPHHRAGLTWTATGYGKRIPTAYMVRFNGRWRRVYCCIYSNIGTTYIGKLSDGLIVNIQ